MRVLRRFSWILIPTILLIVGIAGWYNRYNIYDWFVLQSYSPSTDVVELASKSGMNDYGKRIFYVQKPKIADQATFNNSCTTREQSIVLGCYTGTNIYIFNVTNNELQGVKEVTASHEMLHAAYDRLSPSERKRIDNLLEETFQKIKNPRIIDLIETYKSYDPTVVSNELHSILGTEIRSLGTDLEAYYNKYFTDRQRVVQYSEDYEAVFTKAKNRSDELLGKITLLKTEITSLEDSLQAQSKAISEKKAIMDTLASSGQNTAYNALVPEYNSLVASYNTDVARLKEAIQTYNTMVKQYNELAVRQQYLINSIDSTYEPK